MGPFLFLLAPCVPPPPKVSTAPRAQVGSFTPPEITVSFPGKAQILVRPASIAPIRTETKELKTQAGAVDVTFKCYGADVMVDGGNIGLCPDEP